MRPIAIEVAVLQKKREEIMSTNSVAKIKQLQWMRAFKDCVAFGILNRYLVLQQLRTTDPDLASLEPFGQYRKQFGQSVLHSMCFNDRLEMLEYFLQKKLIGVDQLDQSDHRPIHIAAMKGLITGNLSIAKILVENGADLLLKDSTGRTVCDHLIAQDPECQQPLTKYIKDETESQHSMRLKEVYYCIINTEARFKPPFCYFSDFTLNGILDLL